MQVVTVGLGERSYPIYIAKGLLSKPEILTQHIKSNDVVVISNATIAELYLEKLQFLREEYNYDEIILPDGEQYKTLASLEIIFDGLIQNNCSRKTTLIALGGGVIGDITGFAAACYQRGINFIQVPTTLLAQVDSSVGGKTAVNHPHAKNMIGAFYQPQAVIADIDVLQTLSKRQYLAGLAEVIKYGCIYDAEFFTWLDINIDEILQCDTRYLITLVQRSCKIKAAIVSQDETEQGLRAILNFGHTFGHALEVFHGYENILHGEAVAEGMMMAAYASQYFGTLSNAESQRIVKLLEKLNYTIRKYSAIDLEKIIQTMLKDKKIEIPGQLRLVLLNKIGDAYIKTVSTEMISDFLSNL